MEVQIISQVILKPSSPTPSHLKFFKLSLLDQLIPAPYAPILLFYPNYIGASYSKVLKTVEKLKQSLSKTLALFYPLAGTIKDDLSIDCNDKGAYFATTKVDCLLSQFLNKPDLQLICKFLPCDLGFNGSMSGTRVTNIQVNLFACGGLAIGLCISHKILDGAALKTFLKSWAGNATGTGEIPGPNFVASSLFPATDLWLRDSSLAMWRSSFKVGKSVTKRFVFDAAAIAALKAMATNSGAPRSPTRVETVSAFLWKCSVAASEANCGFRKSSMLTHVVNLRTRAAPTLSENSIGNLIWIAGARCLANHDNTGLPALADQIQHSISKINGDYVKKLQGNEGSALMRKSLKEIGDFGSKEEVDYLGFSSWCGFGFYDIDFGWGKPIWVSSIAVDAPVFMNLIILMETRFGDGIEAWVTLDEQEMDILQNDQEFQAFVSMDPSPLNLESAALV